MGYLTSLARLLRFIATCTIACSFTIMEGDIEANYPPIPPEYIPGLNSPPIWRLPGMRPMEPWQTPKHSTYHKLYEERIFPPMFWNYAWVNWMPKTQGWWAGNRKLQLTTSLPYGSFYGPNPWYLPRKS